MSFPTTILSQGKPTENTFLDDTGFFLDTIISTLIDEVTALETKVGIDSSLTATTIDYLLKNSSSIDPGHKHTTASLNLTSDQNFVTAAQLVVIGNTSGTNTGDQTVPVKATGTEIDTGTDDTKFITPKALDDSDYAKTSDITVTASSSTTLSNKRINPRIVTATSYTTDTGTSLDVSTCDEFDVTAQAGALKLNNPGGTPVNGQKLIVRIKDNGTAIALTYDTQFRASSDLALPTTTVLSKTLYMGFIWNSADSKWDLLAVLNNF